MRVLKDNGVPRRIETRIFLPQLKDEASRIVAGFYALGWTDEAGRPSDDLPKLVGAFGDESWASTLAEIIPRAYPFLQGHDLEGMSNPQLRDEFISHVGRDAASLRNAETFFLCLASEAGLPMSEGFSQRAARGIAEAKKWMRLAELETSDEQEMKAPESAQGVRTASLSSGEIGRLASQIVDLTALLSEGDMTDREKEAVVILLSYLGRKGKREVQ